MEISDKGLSAILLAKREKIKEKTDRLVNAAEINLNTIELLSPEKQISLNTLYNNILAAIDILRNEHPVSDIAPAEKSSKTGISKKITLEKGPDNSVKYIKSDSGKITSISIWEEGTKLLRNQICNLSENIENIRLDKTTDELNNFINELEKKYPPESYNPDYIRENGFSLSSITVPHIFDILDREINSRLEETEPAEELFIVKNNIKKREKIYKNGLMEAITNHREYKKTVFSDINNSFEIVHTIFPEKFERHIFNSFDGTSVESKLNYKSGEIQLNLKKPGEFLLKHRRNKNKNIHITELHDEKGCVKKLLSHKDENLIIFSDKINSIEYKEQIFSDKTVMIGRKEPGMREISLTLLPYGGGSKKESDREGNMRKISWMPEREITYLEEKLSNGNLNKTYSYKNGVIRKINSFAGGGVSDIIQFPLNIKKEIHTSSHGKKETLSFFPGRETRHTIRYPEGTFFSEVRYKDNSTKTGKVASDGTVSLTKKWANGIYQESSYSPKTGTGIMETVFPGNYRERKTIYPDRSCLLEIHTPGGNKSLLIPEDLYMKRFYSHPLFKGCISAAEHMKLLKNPFYNLHLTVEPEIWLLALAGGPGKVTGREKISDKIKDNKDAAYIRQRFTFKIRQG